MFIYDWELTPVNLWLNPRYTNAINKCRFRKNDMTFEIEIGDNGKFITLLYEVVFELISTCDIVGSASFTTKAKFETTRNKEDDIIAMNRFLNEVFSKIIDTLKHHSNIPNSMINTPIGILSAYDTGVLTGSVFLELTECNLYD